MRYILLLTFLHLGLNTYSETIIKINDESENSISVPNFVYLLEDSTGELTLDQIILSKTDKDFTLNSTSYLNFGFTKSIYWLKFSMINETDTPRDFILGINYPLLFSIDFYSINGVNLEKHIASGERYSFSSREIKNRNYLFDLKLNPGITYNFYVRVSSQGGPLQIPIKIQAYKSFIDSENNELMINGLFLGMFVFVFLFNLFLMLIKKGMLNLFYSIYVALLTLFLLNISGFSFQYLWPNLPWFQKHSTLVFSGLANVFLILFAQRFFNYKLNFGRIYKISNGLIAFVLLLTILSLFEGQFFATINLGLNISSLITVAFLTLISMRGLRKQNHMHYYFVFSFIFFLLGVGLYVFNNLGIYTNSYIALMSLKVGFLLEVVLLMFAVLHKYKSIENQTSKELENIVLSRTKELEDQKKELLIQKTEIIYQRDKIINQHRNALKQSEMINNINKEINDSINYAKTIQNAVLTPKSKLDKALADYFILNMPKATLWGDFFWFYERNQRVYFAVADCTGHGVPGAMISMLGIAALNDIVLNEEYLSPAEILNKLSTIVEKSLHQPGNFGEAQDGMDINICMIDKVSKTILSAGTNNPVYIFRESVFAEQESYIKNYEFDDNHLIAVLPDKLPIGYNHKARVSFKNKKVNLKANDMIYLFSDGYADQFGGLQNKKYQQKRFRQLLSENATIFDNQMQHQHVQTNFKNWKGEHDQIDDVMIFGVRV